MMYRAYRVFGYSVNLRIIGYAHNDVLAAVCAILGIVSRIAYMFMALDSYERARKAYPYH